MNNKTKNQRISYSIPLQQQKNQNQQLLLKVPTQLEAASRPSHPNPLILPIQHQNHSTKAQQLPHPAHCLGVNALALDLSTLLQNQSTPSGILYTAGKDGLVAAWELNLPTQPRTEPHKFESSFQINHKDLHQTTPTQFRQCIQSHTNWCNDILLCNYNQTLISASSDRTVKAWSPHDPNLSLCAFTIGTHNDYVKCLAHSPLCAWVASAGLDRKIFLWDINETRPKPLLRFPENSASTSIYSLATTPTGQLLAAGSPAQPIGLYDPRLCSQVAKLVGHTDNVRSILLSNDGTRLLSASSDTTVKMWDVRMQRCLHTFSHHSTSVWSLHSQHPSLQVFHSGDRSGWLCKVDLEGSDDFGEGECVVLCQAGRQEDHILDPSNLVNEGIVKIVALDDAFVWTATGCSSIHRWRDIPTRLQRRQDNTLPSSDTPTDSDFKLSSPSADDQRQVSTALPRNPSSTPSPMRSPQLVSFNLNPISPPASSLPPSLSRDCKKSPPASIVQSTSNGSPSCPPQFIHIPPNKLNDIPLESLVPLFSPFDNLLHYSDRPDPESITIHSLKSFSSNPSAHKSPNDTLNSLHQSISPLNSRVQEFETALPSSIETQLTPTVQNPLPRPSITRSAAWRLYTTRDSASEAVPLRDRPDEIIPGCSGLVKSQLLNDRRHVITFDTNGKLALWDIICCVCVGVFDTDDLELEDNQGSSIGSTASPLRFTPTELLKLVRERIEGQATVGTWCTVETQTGLLTIHLDENRCFDAEVYADESGLSPEIMSLMKEDHRLSLGKWILRNLFDGFITRQAHLRSQNGLLKSSEASTVRPTGSTGPTDPLHQTGPRKSSEEQENSMNSDNTELPQQHHQFTGKIFIPRTPGMSIALATPALTPALPPDIKHIQASNGTMKITQGLDSVSHPADYFSLPRVVEADEDKLIPETANNGLLDSSTDVSSSYSSSINPPSSPRRDSPAPISIDGHPRAEDKIPCAESPGTLNTPSSSVSQQNSASIFTRFKSLGRGQKRRGSQDPHVPAVISNPIPFQDTTQAELNEQQEALMEQKKLQQQKVQTILSRPFEPIGEIDAPKLSSLPQDTTILISEEQAETGAWEVSYRGLVATTYDDAELLLHHSPAWLLDFLLGSRISPAHAAGGLVKVTFVLQPEGGPEAAGLPVLANGNARLTASRALRMKKVASYVIQKLDTSKSSQHPNRTKLSSPQHLKTIPTINTETSHQNTGPKSKSTGSAASTSSSPTTSHPNHHHELSAGLSQLTSQQDSTRKEKESSDATKKSMSSASSPVLSLSPTSTRHAPSNNHSHKLTIDESQIVLSCNGHTLNHTVCLGVVKQYFWIKNSDVVIHYRLSDHEIPTSVH